MLIILIYLLFTVNGQNLCTQEKCNSNTSAIVCCSNELKTIVMPVKHDRCFFFCNLTCIHHGPCECPANCYNHLARGLCLNSRCVCNNGYTGPDCSQIKCPNLCSRNGKCVSTPNRDYCECSPGYTGIDCSTYSFPLPGVLPYGEVVKERPQYYDEYKDHHPIFNISSHSNFHLKCDPKDIQRVYDARTMWINEWAKCDLYFKNDQIQYEVKDVGFRVKGSATRMRLKKNFKISFNQFGHSSRKFFGVRQIGFKSSDPGLIRSFITFEMYRALNIPVQRSSFASIFINDMNFGVYWMSEEVRKEFLEARFEEPKGTLYKCGLASASLAYMGDDTEIYRLFNKTMFQNRFFGYIYQKEYGKGDFKDFVRLVRVLDSKITPDTVYQNYISQMFNVDMYLRLCVIEALTGFADGYTLMNNNALLYNEFKTNKFEFWPYDYDSTYEYDWDISGEYDDWAKVDIFKWGNFSKRRGRSIPYAPLALRTLNVPDFKKRYANYFRIVLARIFNPFGVLIQRIDALRDYLAPFVSADSHFIMNDPVQSVETFRMTIDRIKKYIGRRYHNAMNQLRNFNENK